MFAGLAFLCSSCNFVSQADFENRVSGIEKALRNVQLCDQRRSEYVDSLRFCMDGPTLEEMNRITIWLELQDGASEENFPLMFRNELRRWEIRACSNSCIFEVSCQEPSTAACAEFGDDAEEVRRLLGLNE